MDTKKNTKPNSKITNFYLIIYNLLSAFGWFYVLYLTLKTSQSWQSPKDVLSAKNLYENTRLPLKILLATAGLEVLNSALKLVPSNPIVVFPQVFIRFLVIWAVADKFKTSNETFALFLLNMTWSLSEVTRYFYYVFNLMNSEPYFLKWARYNLFIILYPIGAISEKILIGLAASYIKPLEIRTKYSLTLPNKFNFSFDLYYFFCFWIFMYLPIFPQMYIHMLHQRKKYLYFENKEKKTN